jgi:hypothetical protein
MGHVNVDEAAISVLKPIKERVEVRDPKGAILGYFEPISSAYEELRRIAFANHDPEKARMLRELPPVGSTTEEVLARLKSLGEA